MFPCRLVCSLTALVLVAALGTMPERLMADSTLNCGAYATKAVEQERQNQLLGCGFPSDHMGVGWSMDFNAHLQWCQQPNIKMENLTAHDRVREAAIQDCAQGREPAENELKIEVLPPTIILPTPGPAPDTATLDILCGRYALDARRQNEENGRFDCGVTGGRWSADVSGHRNWCMTAGIGAADEETRIRNAMLNDCKRGGMCRPDSDCGPYLCNTDTGACFNSCLTTMDHCAQDFVCDRERAVCRHKSEF